MLMFTREGERLEELNVLDMSCIQLMLAIDVGQDLATQMRNKKFGLEAVIPMLKGPYNSIELLIICVVIES